MQNRPLKTILPGMPFNRPRPVRAQGAEAAWRLTRTLAALFSLVVALVMLVNHLSADAIDPLTSPELKPLKEKLRLTPADEPLKQQIRQTDLQMRSRYFRRLSQTSSGVYLLLAGAAVFLVAAGQCARYRRQPPIPQKR